MSVSLKKGLALAVAVVVACLAWQFQSQAQTAPSPSLKEGRFEFEVIESFNSKYLGDTPGHIGRGGKLEGLRPNVALGDKVFRGKTRIGTVSNVTWDRARSSMDVEFDPEPLARVAVGEVVWIKLDGSKKEEE